MRGRFFYAFQICFEVMKAFVLSSDCRAYVFVLLAG